MGSTSVLSTGNTLVYADLGTSPGTAIVGFPPGIVLGEIRPGGVEPTAAQADARRAYNALAAMAPTQNLTGQQLGKGFSPSPAAVEGTILGPGVYRFNGDALLRGQLRLDGRGNPNSVFVFQITGDFRVEDGSVMSVQNGAQPKNIFFQIGGNLVDANGALVGTAAALKGNMLVQNDITLSNGTTHEGRLLSLGGNVLLSDNTIFLPTIVETDLAITKTVDRTVVSVGDTVTYTITVRNQGPDDATGVTVTETFPSQIAFLDYTGFIDGTPANFAYNPSTGVFVIGDLAFGQIATIRVRARVLATGNDVRNRVTVIADQPDPDDDNDEDEEPVVVTPVVTDLQVVKMVDKTRANVGDALTYTITIRNNGPNNATGVFVRDVLPLGQINVTGQTATTGNYNVSTGIWTVGNLAAGVTATLTINATITGTGTIVNTAVIRGNQSDQQPGNNTSTVVTVVGNTPAPGPLADLQVVKAVNRTRASIGDVLTYTITARNAGPDAATGVKVTDVFPAAFLNNISASVTAGTYDQATGIWNIGNLAVGSIETLTVTATITANGNVINTAVIRGDQTDERPENNTSTVITIVGAGPEEPTVFADVQVVKTVDKTRANVGDNLTYRVTARNNGPATATNVLVTDVFPMGQVDLGTATVNVGSYDPATGVWQIGTLTAGQEAVLTVTGPIKAAGTIVNTAVIRSNEADPQPQNNTSTVITVVGANPPGALADLQVIKTVDKTRANVGDALTYTIRARNNGPANATGVVLVDMLPMGQLNITAPPVVSTGSYNMTTGIWAIGNLAAGQEVTLQVTGVITATGTIVNTATIGGNEADQQPGNNTSTVVTVVGPGTGTPENLTDLQVVKTVDKSRASQGQSLTYTITARNNGPATATGVTVTDAFPTGQVTLNTPTVTAGTSFANGVWTIGALAPGQEVVLTVSGTITIASGTIVNTAVIRGSNTQTDERPENNTSTVITIVSPTGPNPAESTDLQVVKTVDKTRATVGQTLTYTITATNNGPNAATGVFVLDVLPRLQATFPAPTVSAGTSFNTSTNIWSIGALGAGQSVTFTVTGTITTAGTIVNTAVIRGNEADLQPQNNTSTVITIVDGNPGTGALADLQVVKTVDKTRARIGDALVYIITARNNGPAGATGVVVRDVLPTSQLNVNGQPSVTKGNYNAATGVWNIGTLAANEVVTMTVISTIAANGSIVNTATISGNEADQQPGNNTSTVVTVVSPTPGGVLTDLQVVKTVDKPTASIGQTLTYTIVARNAGPSNATGVTVTDRLPQEFLNTITASGGNYTITSGTLTWTIGNLAAGQTATLTVTGTITKNGTVVNTAVITGNETDERPENNTSTVITVVTPGGQNPEDATDLQVVKTVDKTRATVGQSLTYTVTVRNNGPNNATGVLVVDMLPMRQANFPAQPTTTSGSYNMATGIWTIGNLGANQTATLTVTGTITANGTIVNTAIVSGNEADSEPQNNTSTVITIVETPTGQDANLAIDKTVLNNVTEVTLGGQITYVLRASNAGPGAATGVIVTDVIPEGFTYASHVAPTGTTAVYSSANKTLTWTIGNLAVGTPAARELRIVVTASRVGQYVNTAVIRGNETDPDDDDNTDSAPPVCVRPTAPVVSNEVVCVSTAAVPVDFTVAAIAGVTNYQVLSTGMPGLSTAPIAVNGTTLRVTIPAGVQAGTYTLTFVALNGNCATNSSTATLTVAAAPAAPGIQGENNPVCAGTTYAYSVTSPVAGITYTWSVTGTGWRIEGASTGTQVQITAGTGAGRISVTATNPTGPATCNASTYTTQNITPGATPVTPGIQDNSGPCAGLNFAVANPSTDPLVTYEWSVTGAGITFTGGGTTATGTSVSLTADANAKEGKLTLTATRAGCGSTSYTLDIDARTANTTLLIPNVFSPNGDGVNDTWVIQNLLNLPDNDLFIYNRWGNEVYKTRGYQNNWTANGLEEATYFYVLRVRGCNGQEQIYRGFVQVVR